MERQRNMHPKKEQVRSPGNELNEMEMSNISDIEF